ncbi:MAG: NAD-dependent epimerase [Flavobacteriales bacterium]|nr:NAD-dependent epimerase [Flavobacteriales bacterium]MCB9447545.1 NAD-dependent epimerase [Flavobacteriales bacterium]
MKKVLVTGNAGFIGFHVARKMASLGYRVVGLDAVNDYYDVDLKHDRLRQQGIEPGALVYGKKVETSEGHAFIQLNLEDYESMMRLFEGEKFDYVIHLAAQAGVQYSLRNSHAYVSSNITGFLNILEGCRRHQPEHLVFASSSSVYGLNRLAPFSEEHNVDHPISLYAATKKADEMMAHTYAHLYGLPATGLRFFTVYGPWGRPDMALFIFTKAILEGKPIKVFNYGEMKRDFTYVGDIVEGVVSLVPIPPLPNADYDHTAQRPDVSSAPYRILNVGNNKPVRLLDFIKILEDKIGKKAIIDAQPLQAGDVVETYADVSHIRDLTGYQPNTTIEAGIGSFVDWYKSYYKLQRVSE